MAANSNSAAGTELRRRVTDRMKGTTPIPPPEDDMPLNDADLKKISDIFDARLQAHLGASAVTNPNSVLNQGISARIGADRRKDLGSGITVVKK